MSTSLRKRRMARNHKRMAKPARLNLVALMDIFTILVLFLIVNNGDVEVLQPDQRLQLPDSGSEHVPQPMLTLRVTPEEIWLDDALISHADAMRDEHGAQSQLSQALQSRIAAHDENHSERLAITIMGDRQTPYHLLKRVMSVCAEQGFRDISLAVNSVPVGATDITAESVIGTDNKLAEFHSEIAQVEAQL